MANALAPVLPLLAPWYRFVEDGDRLLLEHGQEVVVLEGAAVRAFLPALLPLLDGTRTIEEVVRVLGSSTRPAVENALTVLGAHGLIVEGPAPGPGDPARTAALSLGAAHGVPPASVAERARMARLVVVGDATVGAEIARIARRAGLAEVTHADWTDAEGDLVVVTPARGEMRRLDDWNRWALERALVWLPILPFDGRLIAVGPLVVPHETACATCVSLRRASNLDYRTDFERIGAVPVEASADPGVATIAAGLGAAVALRWLLAHDTFLPGQLFAVESAPIPQITAHGVLRVPRCPACSQAEFAAPPLPWHEARAA